MAINEDLAERICTAVLAAQSTLTAHLSAAELDAYATATLAAIRAEFEQGAKSLYRIFKGDMEQRGYDTSKYPPTLTEFLHEHPIRNHAAEPTKKIH